MNNSDRRLLYSSGLPEKELDLASKLLGLEWTGGGTYGHKRVAGVTIQTSTGDAPMIFIDVALTMGFADFNRFRNWLRERDLPAESRPAEGNTRAHPSIVPDFVRITDESTGHQKAYALRTEYVLAKFSVGAASVQHSDVNREPATIV